MRIRRRRAGRSAPASRRIPAVMRVLAAVLLLCIGRASVAVALGCVDDPGPAGTAGVAVISPAASTQDGPAEGAEAGVCLCACGCAHGQAAAFAVGEPVGAEPPAAAPPRELSEHSPPTPVLPLRLRPPLA